MVAEKWNEIVADLAAAHPRVQDAVLAVARAAAAAAQRKEDLQFMLHALEQAQRELTPEAPPRLPSVAEVLDIIYCDLDRLADVIDEVRDRLS